VISVKLSLHPEVEADVAGAIAFYDSRTAGLGSDFLGEVLRTFERIESAPEAWPLVEGPVRRCLVDRFPYGVYYRVDLAIVLAVMHGRRRPGAWKGRL
jgi:plasmid stabilization system protein ParE